ncbi:MAG TPA: DUF1801 domain-containing protein [Rhizomicrobium sp.]|nr:DUF1801 domain-containing protein [Rhizomicrobium sp.]
MAENKTKPTGVTVASFVAGLPDEGRRAEARAVVKLLEAATGEKPRMWGTAIVGFGLHHYKYESGREGDMPLVGFAPRKPALVFYGLAGVDGAEALRAKLGKHTTGKGCLYVKKLADIDQKVLATLAAKSAKARRGK